MVVSSPSQPLAIDWHQVLPVPFLWQRSRISLERNVVAISDQEDETLRGIVKHCSHSRAWRFKLSLYEFIYKLNLIIKA
jgi:hypothetical protein